MKALTSTFLIVVLVLQSCVSTKVGVKNNYNYESLELGKKYIIIKQERVKVRQFTLQKITDTSLVGTIYNGTEQESITIAKEDIVKVNKPSTGKTIATIAGAVVLLVIFPAWYENRPVGQ